MDTLEEALVGRRNIYSEMANIVASRQHDVRKQGIKESLWGFQNMEHRLEEVARVRGIRFINDSKATNVNAAWYALESMEAPVIWIAGGQDNTNDYHNLTATVRQKVKTLICIGADNSFMTAVFKDHTDSIIEAGSMEEAVQYAYLVGRPGDTVLLSPACPSFDRFENYADRGTRFRTAVYDL